MAALSFCGTPMPNELMNQRSVSISTLAVLAVLLAAAWMAYAPGLNGSFLFDDYVNLDALGNDGRVDNWRTFWRYITSGTADPGGRPLSLLSFLLDARNWPADPAPFLRTNLTLHLVNGTLLFILLRQLGHALDSNDPSVDAVALLGAGLWLTHPLFISTVFYIVQRQAMLPSTFTLLALIAYTSGRRQFVDSDGVRGLALMAAGVVLGTLFAMGSKLNGVLVPLLCLTLEITVFSKQAPARQGAAKRLRRLQLVVMWAPSLVVLVYLAALLRLIDAPLSTRPWTIGERMLTESRVIVDYLQLLFVPRSVSSGLFNDGYQVSTNILNPLSTLWSIAFLAGLLALAVRIRLKHPDIALAVFFFAAGHVLESTVVPLELYFEHRNYLPSMLLFWPIARALFRSRANLNTKRAIGTALIALLVVTSFQRAVIWGQPDRLTRLWANQNPSSVRAQAAAAISDLESGRVQTALERLAPLWNANPHDLQIAFNFIDARCAAKGPSAVEKKALADALRHTSKSELLTYNWLSRAITVAAMNECPGLELRDVELWLHAATSNPIIDASNIRNQDVEPLLGQLALERKRNRKALQHFNNALIALPSPDVAARQASMLASAGAYEEALEHLDVYEANRPLLRRPGVGMPWLHMKVLEWQGYWPREMSILRRNLRRAIQEKGE